MVVRELLTKWGFDVDEKPLRRLDDAVGSLKVGVAAVLGAATAAAGALFGLAASTAKAGDEAREAAQRVGLNVELLQELQHAARLGGVEAEALQGSLVLMSRRLVEAADKGGPAAEAFKRLGLKIKGADGQLRSTDEVLLMAADRFAAMPDGAKKTALALDLFGRSGAALIPVLNQGAKGIAEAGARFRSYGAVVGEEAAAKSDQFADSLVELDAMLLGLKLTVGTELIPVVGGLIEKFGTWLQANRELIAQKAHQAIEFLKDALAKAWELAAKFTRAVESMADKLGGAEGMARILRVAVEFLAAKMVVNFVIGFAGALKALAASFASAGAAATALNLAVALLPTLIATAVTLWIENWEEISALPRELADGLGMLGDAIASRLSAAAQAVGKAFSDIGDWVQERWQGIKDFFFGVGDGIRAAFASAFDWVIGKVTAVRDAIRGALGKVAGFLGIGSDPINVGAAAGRGVSPATAPAAVPGGRSVNVDARLEFNLPAGASPAQAEELASRVRSAVRDELGALTREAAADAA